MKEFTLCNGAGKIIGAGLSTLEIHIEVSETSIALGSAVIAIGIVAYLIRHKLRKKVQKTDKEPTCKLDECQNPSTALDSDKCSHLDVECIIQASDGFVGVQKTSFFYFFDQRISDEFLPTLDLSEFSFFEISPSLTRISKQCKQLDLYWPKRIYKFPREVNPQIEKKIRPFLISNQKTYPFFSRDLCIFCKEKIAHQFKHCPERVELPVDSFLIRAIKRTPWPKKV